MTHSRYKNITYIHFSTQKVHSMKDFLYSVFAFLPFMVCLVWFVIYTLEFRAATPAKRFLTFFAGVCTILYLCHAWFRKAK